MAVATFNVDVWIEATARQRRGTGAEARDFHERKRACDRYVEIFYTEMTEQKALPVDDFDS